VWDLGCSSLLWLRSEQKSEGSCQPEPMLSPLHARPPERERDHLSSGDGGIRAAQVVGRRAVRRWRRRSGDRRRLESSGGESGTGARKSRFFSGTVQSASPTMGLFGGERPGKTRSVWVGSALFVVKIR
jgi:hypothetical protein